MTDFDSLSPRGATADPARTRATRRSRSYDLPAGSSGQMLNLSENATYKVEAPDGRRWALRVHRDGYHSRRPSPPNSPGLIDLRQTGVVTTPDPGQGQGRRDHPGSRPPAHGRARATWCCSTGRRVPSPASARISPSPSRCWARSPRACISMRGSGSAPPGSRASPGISTRHWAKTSRTGAAGATAWAWTREKEQLFQRTVDLIGTQAQGLWQGAGPLRPHPLRPAARQPADRRQGGEGHRLRRLRLRLVHV